MPQLTIQYRDGRTSREHLLSESSAAERAQFLASHAQGTSESDTVHNIVLESTYPLRHVPSAFKRITPFQAQWTYEVNSDVV